MAGGGGSLIMAAPLRRQLFGILSWTGNESISRNPSGVPILDNFTTHGAFKAADLARLCNVLAAVINRAAFTGSMTGF